MIHLQFLKMINPGDRPIIEYTVYINAYNFLQHVEWLRIALLGGVHLFCTDTCVHASRDFYFVLRFLHPKIEQHGGSCLELT